MGKGEKIALGGGLAALALWYFIDPFPPQPVLKLKPQAVSTPVVPGWKEISYCSPFYSGKQMLTFRKNGVVELRDDLMRGSARSGTWGYDAGLGHFHTAIEQQPAKYFLMRINSDSICILATGSPTAANLETAWFSHNEQEDPRDYDPD
jgi:hypothetical protein